MTGLPAAATAVSRRIPGPARIRDQLRDRDPARAHTRGRVPTLARVQDRIRGRGLALDLVRVPGPILDPVHTPGLAPIHLLRRRPRRTGTTRSGMPPP